MNDKNVRKRGRKWLKFFNKQFVPATDESDLNWLTTSLLAASLLVVSFVIAIVGYIWIVKKHFPNLIPKNDQTKKSKTR